MLSTSVSVLGTGHIGDDGTEHPDRASSSQAHRKEPLADQLLAQRPYFVDAFHLLKRRIQDATIAVDLGCGHDMTDLRILGEHGCSLLIGIDMLDRPSALRNEGRLAYIRGDVDESGLPLRGDSCDIVILNNILEHLHNPMNTLAEAVRILRRGGLLVIVTPNQADLKNRLLLLTGGSIHFPLRRWLLQGEDRVSKGSRNVFIGHVREYTARELLEVVSLIGCELVEIKHVATARAEVPTQGSDSLVDRMQMLTRRSRFLFGVYSILERIVPSFRAQISVVAVKV